MRGGLWIWRCRAIWSSRGPCNSFSVGKRAQGLSSQGHQIPRRNELAPPFVGSVSLSFSLSLSLALHRAAHGRAV